MTPAVRYVGLAGMASLAAVAMFMVWACRNRWFHGFVIDEDLAAGDPDDDIWENLRLTADDVDAIIDSLIVRVNEMRAARGKPPLTKAEWDANTRHLQREVDSAAEEPGWRS